MSSLKVLCPDEGRKTNVREKSVFSEGKCYVQMRAVREMSEIKVSSLKVLCPDEGRKRTVRDKSVFSESKCYV